MVPSWPSISCLKRSWAHGRIIFAKFYNTRQYLLSSQARQKFNNILCPRIQYTNVPSFFGDVLQTRMIGFLFRNNVDNSCVFLDHIEWLTRPSYSEVLSDRQNEEEDQSRKRKVRSEITTQRISLSAVLSPTFSVLTRPQPFVLSFLSVSSDQSRVNATNSRYGDRRLLCRGRDTNRDGSVLRVAPLKGVSVREKACPVSGVESA